MRVGRRATYGATVTSAWWAYDWKANEGWIIPKGFQVGHITKIGRYNYNLSAEFLWTLINHGPGPGPVPERGVKFGLVWLLPE